MKEKERKKEKGEWQRTGIVISKKKSPGEQ